MSAHDTGRLVITGHTADGRSVIVADQVVPDVELVGNAVRFRRLWGRDDIATFPDNGSMPDFERVAPGPGGCRFSTLTLAAGSTRAYHAFVASALGDLAEPAHPGFHRTPTLDLVMVVAGEFVLEVDDGQECVLRKGDSAVLNGVRHRWHNRGEVEATLVAVMIGAVDQRS